MRGAWRRARSRRAGRRCRRWQTAYEACSRAYARSSWRLSLWCGEASRLRTPQRGRNRRRASMRRHRLQSNGGDGTRARERVSNTRSANGESEGRAAGGADPSISHGTPILGGRSPAPFDRERRIAGETRAYISACPFRHGGKVLSSDAGPSKAADARRTAAQGLLVPCARRYVSRASTRGQSSTCSGTNATACSWSAIASA